VEHSYIGITIQRARGVTIERVRIVGEGIITGELHATEIEGKGVGDGAGTLLRGDGIWLYDAIAPVVRDSEIRTVRDGVLITYGTDPVIEGSLIADSRYAVHDMYAQNLTITDNRMVGNLSGTVLMYGGPVTVEGNTITDSGSASTGFGILVKDAGGVTVSHNVIADNRVGILVDDAGRTEGDPTLVDSTTFAMNQVGALLVPSADASFTGNGFIENTTQVALHGQGEVQAVWGSNGTGNYWSDYGGFDAAGDGVGDLAYVRSGRTSELIARQPILLALASGPAFRLLTAVEDRWAPVRPVVNDEHPLTSMTSPPVSGLADGGSPPLAVIGVAMLALAGGALGRTRRRGGGVHA
jgi:nitrous oxidase accessory protein